MSEVGSQDNQQDRSNSEACCPLCFLMGSFRRSACGHTDFFTHMRNARIEMLRAVKSLIDDRITSLEKQRDVQTEKKKSVKIEVE